MKMTVFGLIAAGLLAQATSAVQDSEPRPAGKPLLMLFYWEQTCDEEWENEGVDLLKRMQDYLYANYPDVSRRALSG